MNKLALLFAVLTVACLKADTARFSVVVLDLEEGFPISNATVRANFSKDIGWRAWTDSACPDVAIATTDKNGECKLNGKTNCGRVCCWVSKPPKKYYRDDGWGYKYKSKNIFGVWQPDNLVVTLRLQRVEHPIPLFVKKATLQNHKNGIGGFDGTNSVVRFDFLKGDWLPPYGSGEVADVEFKSTLNIKGKAWFSFEPRKYDWVYFYNLGTELICLNKDDGFSVFAPEPCVGIKIRNADATPKTRRLGLINIGRNQKFHKNGEDWDC